MPWHILPHLAKHAGIPAAIGMVILGLLSLPQQDATPKTDYFGQKVYMYHNAVGGSGLTFQEAAGACFGFVLLGAFLGFLVGAVLVWTKHLKPEDTKFPE
jgi:hypothetical protein